MSLPAGPAFIVEQFFHHPWHGLRFWDLVQPAFMMMAGTAMYISFHNKTKKGVSWQKNFNHVAIRCFKLFIFGTALHCVYAGRLVWELWNVLTQLSVTTIIAYLIIRKPMYVQVIFSIALLVLTEILYRMVLMPGFDEPFVTGKNFGNWMDTILMGKVNSDGWVAINILPMAAHTIWGAVAGKLLVSKHRDAVKIKYIIISAVLLLLGGYILNGFGITPIIKRISTSSFVLVSGGWVLIIMALLYLFIDVKKYNRYAWMFVVVGMNAIFIYMFFETVGVQWLNKTVSIFVNGLLGFSMAGQKIQAVFSAITTLFVEWSICFWLFKNKIFFKL